MSDIPVNPPHVLLNAVNILRACQPLSDRLIANGVTIELTNQEQAHLLKFEQLLMTDYTESDWSYLRVASGVKVNGVAALTSCLTRFRATAENYIYGQL